jgi:hypothetical protein
MSFADEILGKISPAIKIERAEQKPEPDPAPGHTGCEDCDHDLRDFAECERCSPPPTPEPAKKPKATVKGKPGPAPGSGKGNSFGIPVLLYTTDKKQYQRLWARCKTHGIKYEEALAMEGKTKLVGRHAKKMGRAPLATTPPKEPERCKDGTLPSKVIKEKIKAATVAIAAAKDGDQVPYSEVIKNTVNPPHEPIINGGLKIGDRVRQVGGHKVCTGIGTVKRAPPGNPEALVSFDNGMEWLLKSNLEAVTV